jgi:poly(ADP-ribose) glycohydrolase
MIMQNLYKGRSEEVSLSRQQVCCLLALCFLNGFPLPPTRTYQHFTLALFHSFALYASQRGKLLCILHYLDRVYQAEISGNNEFLSMCISVSRHHLKEEDPALSWGRCESHLTLFDSPTDGGLIEGAHGCLQVDFANAYIGGGVLNMGNVQVNMRGEIMKVYTVIIISSYTIIVIVVRHSWLIDFVVP